ncbi:uncharacterized protein BKA55DRAFT_697693 [Fusarium redolens]|uniref:Uncharacterized protein n=1 Tax=Fusarium redolens TaxID=48865 RepID=A0A9P9FXR3_FUSRE|nr:uncharacterized protein BKA55DRAFT_697693 [Fusarium redolens]KAH7216989.1 hypothetical protein BKA55DRAFT_697693 [Fusarium redolens]
MKKGNQDYLRDKTPNSALLAMQLNDPNYQLAASLDEKKGSGQETASPPPFSLTSAATGSVQELRSLLFMTATTVPRVLEPDDDADPSYADPIVSPSGRKLLGFNYQGKVLAPRSSRLAGPPVYKCNVYSLQQNFIIQSKDCISHDIVFSVLVSHNEYSSYQLTEFDIAIELGTSDEENCIMETYVGPGASMLSNLRFNVLMSFTTMSVTERKCLLSRVIPRSHKGWIRMQDVQEMSFTLTLAQLNNFGMNRRFSFYTSAYCKFDHEDDPITHYFEDSMTRG